MKNSILRDALISVGLNRTPVQMKGNSFHYCFKGNSTSKTLLNQGGLLGYDKLNNVGFSTFQAVLDSSQYVQLKSLLSKEPDIYYLRDKSSYWLFFPIKHDSEAKKNIQDQINSNLIKKKNKERGHNDSLDIQLLSDEKIRKFPKEYVVSSEGFETLELLKKSADFWALTFSQSDLSTTVIEVFKSKDGLFRLCKKKPHSSPSKSTKPSVSHANKENNQMFFVRLRKKGFSSKYDNRIADLLSVINDIENIRDVRVFKERLGIPVVALNGRLGKGVHKGINKFYKINEKSISRKISFIEMLLQINVDEINREYSLLESIKNKKNNGTDAQSILKVRKALPKIGLGLESNFKPERIKIQDIKLDERTKAKHDKHIMYTAGWSLNGAFTKE
tara:strand:- start:476 stop:1642 length:1167 start_codon:yes stop_codon:yes gene_type:complete